MRGFAALSIAAAVFMSAHELVAQAPAIPGAVNTKLKWLQNYAAALKKAEAEKKPVLIDFTTDWCGWSKKMDRETIIDPAVQELLQKFVLVRINPEVSEENETAGKKYGVDSYPTFVVANYKGEEIGQSGGYIAKKEFIEFINKYHPLFKKSPLGYKGVELDANDPLFAAIKLIPPSETRPTTVGSFVVLDRSEIRVQPDGSAKYMTRTATYITDPDRGDLPDAERHYNSSREKTSFKTVRILDVKGKGREVDVALSKDEHAYSNQNVYWDVRRLSLELPTLKEGQILDVIEERDHQPVMPGQFFYHWNTGTRMLLSSELYITFPASLKLEKRAVRSKGVVKETKNADGTITWVLKTSNPEPYEPALFSPPFYEIWEGYEFFTPCKSDDIGRWYSGLCRGRDQLPESARSRIIGLKRTSKTQPELLQAIMDWVTKDIRYVSVGFGMSSHQPHPAGETLVNLYGDCKDQSMLVQSLCHEAGIPASLVLVNAYGAGFNESSPAVEMFNHCIVEAKADGTTYYLDPASGQSKIGHLPQSYSGSNGLKVDAGKGVSVSLPPYRPKATEISHETIVKLNPNGTAIVTDKSILTGDSAKQQREKMKGTTPEKVRTYLQDSYKRSGRKLLDFFMTDSSDKSDTYETRISYTVPRFGSMTAGGLVFKMGASDDDGEWISTLRQPRTQPFRFYASDPENRSFTVELPPGAVLKGKPDDVQINAAFLQASRKLVFQDNRLSMNEVYAYLDARLAAGETEKVFTTFQQLQDHRDYSFMVQMPPRKSEQSP